MIFQRIEFILLFILVFFVYWLLEHKYQNRFLLIASYIFCALSDVKYLFLLIIQSLASFISGICINKYPRYAKIILFFSIGINLSMLGFYKYYNFFVENINNLISHISGFSSIPLLQIMLPVGISFYTFQNIGYIIDVFRKTTSPCTDIINYGLFASFFPKFIAGPIERSSNLLCQIGLPRTINIVSLVDGLYLILWGYFQKFVIADNISVICKKIFLLENPSFFILCAGAFAFTIQIFSDFSGYTDLARGYAKLLGFDLLKNFNNPYFATSPSDFWRRWHMSLSQWIRDYIYIPLGGSRVSTIKWIIVLFITFSITGLWHGASWNFILWGLYYWLLYLLYRGWNAFVPGFIKNLRYGTLVSIPLMFIFTNLGWLIFKETDSAYLWKYFTISIYDWDSAQLLPAVYLICYTFIYSLPLFIVSVFMFCRENGANLTFYNRVYFKIVLIPLLLLSILLFKSTKSSEFIYFNF